MNNLKNKLISFEKKISDLWESGELPYLIHLSSGNEEHLINIFNKYYEKGDWVFSTHRNHYHALLSGVSEEKLLKEIIDGNSMFIFDKKSNFYTSAILGGNACIAAGVAYAIKQLGESTKVLCFLGDGAEEEGNFYEAVMMVESHNLPCLFIIEDNDRSVDTTLIERSPTKYRITWPKCVLRYKYESSYPHAGNGTKNKIIFKNDKL